MTEIRVDVKVLVPIVWRAARHFRDRAEVESTEQKGYGNYVTAADKAVQQEIYEALAARYPQVQFLAEEKDNEDIDTTGDFWILDPIDGTMNLMHDFAHSAISLGYAQDGELALGIIYDPYRDEMFYGETGKGAWLLQKASAALATGDSAVGNGKNPCNDNEFTNSVNGQNWTRIHVSSAQSLADSVAIIGTTPYNRDQFGDKYNKAIWQTFLRCQDIRRFGAAVLDLAWVACGRAEVYFEHVYAWDRAAGSVIIREAGGSVCSFDGSAVPIAGFHDIIAGTPGVVAEVAAITKAAFGVDGDVDETAGRTDTERAAAADVMATWTATEMPVAGAAMAAMPTEEMPANVQVHGWPCRNRMFSEEEMYQRVYDYAVAAGAANTLAALPYARARHAGQMRKGGIGVPYIYHPLLMVCHALALHLTEDALLAALLLHDVCEDCRDENGNRIRPEDLPVDVAAQEAVRLVTKPERLRRGWEEPYFGGIAGNRTAVVVKILDRCNNISMMASAFNANKMAGYIKETEQYILPLLSSMERDSDANWRNAAFLLRYQMLSTLENLKRML